MRSEEGEGDDEIFNINIEDLVSLPDVIVEFITLFSRLEFAMLLSGYASIAMAARA